MTYCSPKDGPPPSLRMETHEVSPTGSGLRLLLRRLVACSSCDRGPPFTQGLGEQRLSRMGTQCPLPSLHLSQFYQPGPAKNEI